MIIHDGVYGDEEIRERVLIDLINSRAVQRLKKISQQGIPKEYLRRPFFSRYEHSLGVMILLRRLGANIKEQIAGLIHDVSHTAFSHVTELLFGDPRKDDFQDKNHLKVIESSDIPEILSKNGFDYKDFIELEKYTLLEREIPHLCADRFDYTIREIFMEEGKEKTNYFMEGMLNFNGSMAFNSYEIAMSFALSFLKYQVYHWGSDEGKIKYKVFAEILNLAIQKGIISIDDLWKDDEHVLNILWMSRDEEVISRFELLGKGSVSNMKKYHKNLPKKFRHIDPLVVEDGKTFVLSEISDDFKKLLNIEKERSMKLNFSPNNTLQ